MNSQFAIMKLTLRNRVIPAAAAALLCACGGHRSGTGLEAISPPDAVAVAVVDLAALRNSAAGRKVTARLRPRTFARFGFDSTDQLDRILLATDGRSFVAGVEGSFDPAHLAARARERVAAAEPSGPGRVIAGDTAAVAGAIQRLAGGGAGLPAPIANLARAIPNGQPVWAVARSGFRFAFPDKSNWRNLNRLLGATSSARLWGSVSSGVSLEVWADCPAADGAGKLTRQLHGLLDMARLSLPANRPEFVQALSGVAVRQDGTSVRLTATVPEELVDWALAQEAAP
jgi:hypothetical protein